MTAVCFPFSADIPVGGGHPSAMVLMEHLGGCGVRPILALHGPAGPAGRWLAERGGSFHQVRFPAYAGGLTRNPARDVAFILSHSQSLARFLRDEGIQIVHANDIWIALTWALPCKLARVKLVWHHRSGARYKLAHKIAFLASDKMIAVSPFAAGRRARHRKSVIVSNPFDTDGGRLDRDQARSRLLRECRLGDSTRILGFFANLNRPVCQRKRPLMVVEALAHLKALAPEQSFAAMFFGTINDDFREQIRRSAAGLEVEEQVFILGFRSPPDPYLLAADVVLTPAVDEGFGRVPIEAMMLGTPVIASAAGNHPELVQDGVTGSLVPPDDPVALAEKILQMVNDDPYRARVVARAREEARERFGAAASARAVAAVYDELLGETQTHTVKPPVAGIGQRAAPVMRAMAARAGHSRDF